MPLRKRILAIKLLAGVILAIGISVGGVAWRLTSGHPIHLGFLAPILQRSLAPTGSIRVELDDIVLAWIPGEQPLGLQALGLRAFAKDGAELGSIGQVGFRVSIPALLQGKFAPSAIDIFHIAIHLHRGADGQFKILGIGGKKAGDDHLPSDQLAEVLLNGPNSDRIDSYLKRIGIKGGSLSFEDDTTGLSWHAQRIDFTITRNPRGIDGEAAMQIVELGNPAEIDVGAFLDAATRRLDLHGSYRGVDIVSLGLVVSALTAASESNLTFAGTFETYLELSTPDPANILGPLHFTVDAGPGTLSLPGYFATPLPIAKLALAGGLSSGFGELALDSLALDLGGPLVKARGKVSGLVGPSGADGKMHAQCSLTVTNLTLADVPDLWPLSGGQSSSTRDWVKSRIDQGKIESAEATFDALAPRDNPGALEILAFNGRLTASGVALRYADKLPAIRDAHVDATFDATKAVFDIAGGGAGALSIRKATAAISGFDRQTQTLEVVGDVAGPLRDTLLLLDQAGAVNLDAIGVKASEVAGDVSANLRFRFPDIANISFADAQPVVSARVVGGRIGGLIAGHDLAEGNIDLRLEAAGIAATGHARLAGVPAEITWNEAFGGDAMKTRIAISARPGADDLARLGLDVRQQIQGPLPMNVVYRQFANGHGDITIDTDLTLAALALDLAKWRKAPGIPAHAGGVVEMSDGRPVAISSFAINAGELSGAGRAQFSGDGALSEVFFGQISLGRTQLRNVALALGQDRLDINIGGGDFDAEPYRDKGDSLGIAARTTAAASGQTTGEARPFAVNVTAEHLDRIFLGQGREIDSLRLVAANDGQRLQLLEADGILRGGSAFRMRWQPATATTHSLSLTADDAGGALKALNVFDDMVGGRLSITATSPDGTAGHPIQGHVAISEYRLVGQSFLLRLFTIATLTGLADGLTTDGLLMHQLVADFQKTYGRVEIAQARTFGPSLALTAEGYFDFSSDSIDIKGVIVPANALNSLIGSVPLFGFLMDQRGNGIGSATYSATGRLSKPTFAVQPLSVIEPAFLRSIFGLSPDSATSTP